MLYFLKKKISFYQFFAILLLLSIFYRIDLFITTFSIALEPSLYHFSAIASGMALDFAICLLLSAALFFCFFVLTLLTDKKYLRNILSFIIELICFLVFMTLTLLFLVNIKLTSSFFINLNYTLLTSYLTQGISALDLLHFLSGFEVAIFVSIIIAYFLIKALPHPYIKIMLIYFILPIYILLAACGSRFFIHQHAQASKLFMSKYNNPANQVFQSYIQYSNALNQKKYPLNNAQLHSIQLIDPIFNSTNKMINASLKQLSSEKQQWNVIFFVLESVGSSYLHKKDGSETMPFLSELSKQGVWFNNNYTGGNISALGQFSMLTGIYPNPTPSHFEMQKNLAIPTISSWLGKNYDSFFVSASNDLYFALGLNKTFNFYANANTIRPDHRNLFSNMFLNEQDGFQYFINRLDQAKKPFLGVYWSAAAHFPYKDYSDDLKITIDKKNAYKRYLVSLSLLDKEIKQVYETLHKKNRLDNTIFIVIGDHGELFGQHQFWIHGNSLHQEEIKVPLLIYAPGLLKAQIVSSNTSSTDILPTVLSIMGISYQNKLQGLSLLQNVSHREYIFIYGDEDELASINQTNSKMIVSFAKGTCVSYDLNTDKDEHHPLPCVNHRQKEAIIKFRNFQPKILTYYNQHNAP